MPTLSASHTLAAVHTFELSDAARAAGCLSASVAGYAAAFSGMRLRKSKALQMSNWEAVELSVPQQQYAATDAWVCRLAFEQLATAEGRRACRAARPALFYSPTPPPA
jgi:ribonuclease D